MKHAMNTKKVLASLALGLGAAAASATAPTCSNLGTLGPPGLAIFGNSFSSPGAYTDCYTFSLNGAAHSFGGTFEIDPLFNRLDIDVRSVSLYSGDSLLGTDTSPMFFAFGDLLGGAYTLAIQSLVEKDPGWWIKPVGYAGALVTVGAPVAPVPEPSTYALMLAGLAAVGFIARRRKQAA
jgi:hypothetical protein